MSNSHNYGNLWYWYPHFQTHPTGSAQFENNNYNKSNGLGLNMDPDSAVGAKVEF
jgi:hypothetical protein